MKGGRGSQLRRRFALELACDVYTFTGRGMAELGSRVRVCGRWRVFAPVLRSGATAFPLLGDLRARPLSAFATALRMAAFGGDYWSPPSLPVSSTVGLTRVGRAFDASRQGRETQRLLGDVDGLAEGFGLLNCGLVGAARVPSEGAFIVSDLRFGKK